jgi:hypothetical protein
MCVNRVGRRLILTSVFASITAILVAQRYDRNGSTTLMLTVSSDASLALSAGSSGWSDSATGRSGGVATLQFRNRPSSEPGLTTIAVHVSDEATLAAGLSESKALEGATLTYSCSVDRLDLGCPGTERTSGAGAVRVAQLGLKVRPNGRGTASVAWTLADTPRFASTRAVAVFTYSSV